MKKTTLLYIGIGAAILLYLLSKKTAAKNLKVYFQSIALKKATGLVFPTVQAVFRVVNPTSSPLTITSIAGDLLLNDKFFSSLSQTETVIIAPNSETLYTINIKTPVFSAIQTIIALFRDKKKVKVVFDGTVNSDGLLLPIKQEILMF
jgi:LEA14-like dessication related protein